MAPIVLSIRPQQDAPATAIALMKRGYEGVFSPLLQIAPIKEIKIEPADAYIFTSQHAAQVFHLPDKTCPLYAIGDATALILQEKGYETVLIGSGDAFSLIPLIQTSLARGSHVVHLSGETVSVDMEKALTPLGFTVHRQIVYTTTYGHTLSAKSVAAIRAGRVFGILVYSPLSAEALLVALHHHGLEAHVSSIHAVCLSSVIAHKIRSLSWKSVTVSSEKSTESLLDNLDHLLSKCHNNHVLEQGAIHDRSKKAVSRKT